MFQKILEMPYSFKVIVKQEVINNLQEILIGISSMFAHSFDTRNVKKGTIKGSNLRSEPLLRIRSAGTIFYRRPGHPDRRPGRHQFPPEAANGLRDPAGARQFKIRDIS